MPPPTCANPLLLSWIKEILDVAIERNTKGVTTYKRAYNSMKACPLTFSHPSEAQQLDGIGPKIVSTLTDKLIEHCEANGLPAPKKPRGKARKRLSADDLAGIEEPAPVKRPRKSKPYVPSLRSGPYAVILALSSFPEDSQQSLSKAQLIDRAQEHCDSSFTVPSESGKFYTAWNSMKTLLDKDLVHERGRPLRKYALTDEGWEVAKRIRAAQKDKTTSLPTKSNTVEEPEAMEGVGIFGRAVCTTNKVHGFLDLEGEAEPGMLIPEISHAPDMQGSINSGTGPTGQRLGGAPIDRYGTLSRAREPVSKNNDARHDFVDLSSSSEPERALAVPWAASHFTQDSRQPNLGQSEPFQPDFTQAMNISSAANAQSKPLPAKNRPLTSRSVQHDLAPVTNGPSAITPSIPRPRTKPATGPKPPSPKPFQPNFAQAMNAPSEAVTPKAVPTAKSTKRRKAPPAKPSERRNTQALDILSPSSSTKPFNMPPTDNPPQKTKRVPLEVSQPASAQTMRVPLAGPSNEHPISTEIGSTRPTSTKLSSSSLPTLPTFDPISIEPGAFTVHLVLDNREVRSKDDRDYISDELTKKGAKPLVRPLELGDFFWVAKMHSPSLLSQYGEEGDEIALDWIVERKRLDDLVGSITDGRFQEQKFRLRKSGVQNVTYLIEEFSISNEKATKFHEAILSAIASTQVVNGYFVKQTRKLDDTIRYLARMTRMLKKTYESKPLNLIPTSALTPTTYLPLLTHLRTRPSHKHKSYNITYSSFASLSSKSDTLTLRDIFLKMLMCTKGISGDKALAIQKQWSTPRAFVEAFEGCASQKEREALVEARLGAIVGRGKVKGVLGAKVAGIWGEE